GTRPSPPTGSSWSRMICTTGLAGATGFCRCVSVDAVGLPGVGVGAPGVGGEPGLVRGGVGGGGAGVSRGGGVGGGPGRTRGAPPGRAPAAGRPAPSPAGAPVPPGATPPGTRVGGGGCAGGGVTGRPTVPSPASGP